MTNVDDVTILPWRRGLTEAEVADAAALLGCVRAADGRAPEEVPGGDNAVLTASLGDRLAGLAWLAGTDPAELYVHPDFRRRGIGRALAAEALRTGGVWAHGTSPAARRLAAEFGARPTRRLLQLRRSQEPTDPPTTLPVELPAGVTIRAFRPGADEDAFLAVNARAFAWHPEQGRLDRAGLAAEMAQPWFDPNGFFLAVDGSDTLLGFHWTKVHREGPEPLGEVYVLGVDPRSPIRHLGTPLTATGLNHLAAQGLRTVLLYVEADNERAVRLYRRFGFTDYAVDTVFEAS